MRNFVNRLVTVATMDAWDDRRTPLFTGEHVTLATMARQPDTIAAVNRARASVSIDRWRELNARHCNGLSDDERAAALPVWNTLPGYTCMADAIAIIARL